MKRLLILTALLMMSVAAVGCRSGACWSSWFNRGAACNNYGGYGGTTTYSAPDDGSILLPPASQPPLLPGPVQALPSR
jgi:hypothetical protein